MPSRHGELSAKLQKQEKIEEQQVGQLGCTVELEKM